MITLLITLAAPWCAPLTPCEPIDPPPARHLLTPAEIEAVLDTLPCHTFAYQPGFEFAPDVIFWDVYCGTF